MTALEIAATPTRAPLLAELEITRRCAATCPKLCYVQAGPTEGHGLLPTSTWLAVIDGITGLPGSHARTRANTAAAVRLGIPVRGQVVEVEDGQHAAEAEAELIALGVTKVSRDRARPVGNAGLLTGRPPMPSDLCGRCAENRLAVLADGTIAPCVLGRFLTAGNVACANLDEVLRGERWRSIRQTVKAGRGRGCAPADSNDCNPAIAVDGVCPPADGNNCDPNDSDDI